MKKTMKKILCSLLVVVLCLTSAPLQGFVGMEWPELSKFNLGEWFAGKVSATDGLAATGQCGEDVYWNYDAKSGKLVISGTGDMYDELWSSPFEDSSIKNVIISEGVTSIGDYTFSYCVDLLSVSIPKSITYIGESAFSNCTSLTSINVDADNMNYSSDSRGVLFDKNKTDLIQYPAGNTNTTYNIPDSVMTICDFAFKDCDNLETITIPDSVVSIGDYAFNDCALLASITIPSSVTFIGEYALNMCTQLKSIMVDMDNAVYSSDSSGVLFNKDKTILIQYPVGNVNTSYTIPDDVITIGNGAFKYSHNTSITIPESVTSIGRSAFAVCFKLTSITIPNSVTTIGASAFESCWRITDIEIPNGVTTIEDRAFEGCSSLKSITIPDSVTSIDVAAFYDTEYYNDSTNWENDMLYIDEYLIEARNSLSDLCVIKVGTKLIADGAFDGCESLTSVIIPYSVTTIGDSAFAFCDNLTSVSIPESITYIGNKAFYHCVNLTGITIPNSVTAIGDFAFDSCRALNSITLPKSVTDIGDAPFNCCNELRNIIVDADNPAYSSDSSGVLFDKNKTTLIQYPIGNDSYSYIIPDTVTTIGKNAFFLSYYLKDITIPNSVKTIADCAFDNCTFTSIKIPDSVTTIGEYAFAYCYNLTRVRIPSSVTSIGWNAFGHCRSLTSITVDAENPSYASDSRGVLYDKNKTILIQYPLGSTYRSYEIPYSVNNIGDEAIYESENHYLTKIYYSGTITEWSKIKVGFNNHITENVYIKCNYDGSAYVVKAGYCGENVTYVLYSNGDLVISGTGPMYDYGEGDDPSYWFPPYTDYYYDEFDEYGESSGDFIIKKVVIKEGVTTIGNYAFQACRNLEEVEISNTVTSIGNVAFDFCTSLKHIKIPGSVKVIGEEAFSESALETIEIENGLERIEMLAFFYCQSLKKVALPESVEYIGDFAFIICDKLETLIINNKDCEIGLEILVTSEMDEDGNLVEDENGNPIPTECPTVLKGHSGSTAEEYAKTWTDAGYPIKFEVISHKFVEQTTFSATCTENGYTLMECSECGHKIKDNIVDPLGHDYSEKIIDDAHLVSKATYDNGSIYCYDCSRCDSIGDKTFELDDKLIHVSSVSLNKDSITLKRDSKQTLTATVSPSNATNKKLTWKSSNTNIAKVDDNGVVTAVGKGSATITVTTVDGGKTDTCTVKVTQVAVTGVALNKSSITVEKGNSYTLTATVKPSDAYNKNITWSSDNKSVATVDSSGKVKALKAGSAKITVTTEDGKFTASCTVNVNVKVAGVHLNTNYVSLLKGETKQLTATINPSDATNKKVTWKSSDTSVVTVDNKGLVTAVGPGSAAITVTTDDGKKTDECYVDVTNQFVLEMDANSFKHSYGNFAGFYYVNEEDMQNLKKLANNKAEKEKIDEKYYSDWNGSCFGIEATIGLAYQERLSLKTLSDSGTPKNFYSLEKPNENLSLLSKINFYHMLQVIDIINNYVVSATYGKGIIGGLLNLATDHVSLEKFMKNMVTEAQKGEPFIWGINIPGYAHGVLVVDITVDNGYYYLVIYDCNTAGDRFYSLRISPDFKKFTYNYESGGKTKSITQDSDINNFTIYSLDNMPVHNKKTKSIEAVASTSSVVTTEISFYNSESFKAVNESGQTLIYDGNAFSGDMPVYDIRFVGSDDDAGKCELIIEVEDSNELTFSELNDEVDISVSTEETYLSITGKKIDSIDVQLDSNVELKGSNMEFEVAMSVDGENGLPSIKASSSKDTIIKKNGSRLIAETNGDFTDASFKLYADGDVKVSSIGSVNGQIVAETDVDAKCNHMCHKSGFMGFIWKILRFFYKLFKINPVCDCGVRHY